MIERLLELIRTKRLTVGELADELGVSRLVIDEMIAMLDRKGKIVKINTGKGIQIAVSEGSAMNTEKLTPSALLEYIKSRGFSTIGEAANSLGVTTDEVRKMLEYLFTKQHLKKIDLAKEKECFGSCSGCHGCDQAAMIQIDGTSVCYRLKAHNL